MKDETGGGVWQIERWAAAVASKLGHGLTALILKDEAALMELGLISPHQSATVGLERQSASVNNGRLTDLGLKVYWTIESYQTGTQ
jgi:hypothetical protein